ncbi:T9SS type A sorting domain-containing protein [candidate division KSB1 bacterium]|nr:T9SS type A sorting domain-containing protein [candidate division KSB1 bacterium]
MRGQNYIIFVLALLSISAAGWAQCLDDRYHTLEELYAFVFELQAQHPDWVKVDSIGHSRGDMDGRQWPIYAVKISNNVQVFEDEPVSLIIMHIHAEEVIGVETSIAYMQRLVTNQGRDLRMYTQMYFVPTMNPDGLAVISDCRDNTWRKNGYRPPQLGNRDCVVVPGVGSDSCGVDLNRNFEFNWIWGDTLWQPAANEPFDYYRGPGPFSEPEVQAIRDLALQIRPTTSIVYHSSRSGAVAERSIIAWQWGVDPGPYKFPPDCTALGQWNRRYVEQTLAYPGNDHFTFVWGGTHNGCLQDWFYWRIGTFQALTESSPSDGDIQPDSVRLEATISAMMPSLDWMNRRMMNFDHDQPAPLAIHTRDASTLQPISAEWRIASTWTPVLAPRTTNEQYGRMTILPPAGPITIIARKDGYADATASTTIQPGGDVQYVTLDLQPLPHHNLTLRLVDAAGAGTAGTGFLDGKFPRWLNIPADGLTVNLAEGEYSLRARADLEGTVVAWRDFVLGGDRTFEIALPASQTVFTENFDAGTSGWTSGGDGNEWRAELDTTSMNFGTCLHTNREGYRTTYAPNANSWIHTDQSIPLAGGNIAYLEFYRRGRLDVPADSFFVEVSTDGGTWERAAGFCDMELDWTRTYVNLSRWIPNPVQLRFRLQADHALGELGMHVDNIRVYTATDSDAPIPPAFVPYRWQIKNVYPNPFNPSTTITYELGGPGRAEIVIFNLLGEEVRRFDIMRAMAGVGEVKWDGANSSGLGVPSGIYFARLTSGGHLATHKLLLIR